MITTLRLKLAQIMQTCFKSTKLSLYTSTPFIFKNENDYILKYEDFLSGVSSVYPAKVVGALRFH